MGFRGEALYSISAVSKVTLISKAKDEEHGSITKVNGGIIEENHEYGCPDGTVVNCRNLFTIHQQKEILGTNSTETSAISNIVQKYILSYPSISFKFINNGKMIYFSPGDGDIVNAVNAVYGSKMAGNVVLVKTKTKNNIWVTGCLGNNKILYKSRTNQVVFVNNRYVKDRNLSKAIEDTYYGLLMKGNHPFFIINIHIDPMLVDVNVHPQKLNVAFSDLDLVTSTIKELLNPYLSQIKGIIKTIEIEEFKKEDKTEPKPNIENEIDTDDVFDVSSILNAEATSKIAEKIIQAETDTEEIEFCDGIEPVIENTPLQEDIFSDSEDYFKPNLNSEITDFSYKASLLLDKDDNTNTLKQISSAQKYCLQAGRSFWIEKGL